MNVTINQREVQGKVKAPSSKSQTIRALMCAALAIGESEITDPLVCDDTLAAIDVLSKVGINIHQEEGVWRVTGGSFRAPDTELFCGESATTLRFMVAICSLIPDECHLVGGPSLSKRPVRSLVEALRKLGVKCTLTGKTPPVTVKGGTLRGGNTDLPGDISSQFISALLLVAPWAKKTVNIRLTTPMTSRPYVLMTLRCLRKFGINVRTEFDKFVIDKQGFKPAKFQVEGDWSSASYFLALGAMSGEIEVENISTSSIQGDRVILELMRSMGAQVKIAGKTVTVSKSKLKGIRADFSDCIDLLPTMAMLAASAEGVSEFGGIERARIKESNRVAAIREGLQKLGVSVAEDQNRLTIYGQTKEQPVEDSEEKGKTEKDESGEESTPEKAPEIAETPQEPVVIDSKEDHRIAMAFGVLGTAIGGVTIDKAECVSKTFPNFWDALKSVGGALEINGK